MKGLNCKPSVQFAYNYTINVLSKCSNIISHRSSILKSRHNDSRSSKVDTSIFEVDTSIFKVDTSIIDLRRSTHRSSKIEGRNIAPTTQHLTKYCPQGPQRCSIVIPKIPRGICITLDEGTHAHTSGIYGNGPTRHYVLYAYLYYVYALVGGAISIRDPYICAVLRVCSNRSHAVFHRPVV